MYNMNFYDSLCRTLTSVYDAILEDLVFPAEIVGKRIRIKLDGSQIIKVHLDKNQQTTIEHKVKHSTLRLDCSHGIVVERYLCIYALLLCWVLWVQSPTLDNNCWSESVSPLLSLHVYLSLPTGFFFTNTGVFFKIKWISGAISFYKYVIYGTEVFYDNKIYRTFWLLSYDLHSWFCVDPADWLYWWFLR